MKTEELDHLFNLSLELLCIADTDGYFIRLNPQWERTLGYPLADLEGKRFLDLVHPEDLEATLGAIAALAGQESVLHFENRYRRADGSYRWIEWSSRPSGKLIYAAARDVTWRKEAAAELERALAENRALLDELQHRVKNSFGLISGMVSLAAEGHESAETREALRELDAHVRSLSELYALLHNARSFTELRLDEYCSRIAASLVDMRGGIRLRAALEPVVVPAAKAAPFGLIATELITNALKYAFPAGGPGLISLELRSAGSKVAFEVKDDGKGLPDGFDLGKSGGLGLKLVEALALQLDGSFEIESGLKGTSCRLLFESSSKIGGGP